MAHRSHIACCCCICVFVCLFQYFNRLIFVFNRLIILVSTSCLVFHFCLDFVVFVMNISCPDSPLCYYFDENFTLSKMVYALSLI